MLKMALLYLSIHLLVLCPYVAKEPSVLLPDVGEGFKSLTCGIYVIACTIKHNNWH